MTDISLKITGAGLFNLAIKDNDLEADDGLENPVILSLFTDARLPDTGEKISEHEDPRGWWGDIGDPDGVAIGSLLWTLFRKKVSRETIAEAEQYCRDALQHFIDDGIAATINIAVERAGLYQINIGIEMIKPTGDVLRYAYLWDGQLAKFQRVS